MGNKEGKHSKSGDASHFSGHPKLKKADLEFLKANTSFDEETITEWYTEFLRDCKNGKLSPKKFMEVYQVLCPGGEAQAFAQHAFRTFDKDRNGYIDFKAPLNRFLAFEKIDLYFRIAVCGDDVDREFLMAVNVTSSGTVEQKLKWAFCMVDIDGNGNIDLGEMTRVISAIQEMSSALTAARSRTTVQASTANASASVLDPGERAKQIFSQMDTNQDGILDEQEFVTGCLNDESLVQMLLISGSLT